jgi:hypothetical protein
MKFKLGLLLAALLWPTPSAAQQSTACVSTNQTAGAGFTAVLEIAASAGGKGFYIVYWHTTNPATEGNSSLSFVDATVIDTVLTSVTPQTFGSKALTSTFSIGRDSSGTVGSRDVDYWPLHFPDQRPGQIFVPAGKIALFRPHVSSGQSLAVDVCIREV